MTLLSTQIPTTVLLRLHSQQLTPRFAHPLLDDLPLSSFGRRSPGASPQVRSAGYYETTVDLVLEPLVYGVIPESVIPTIYWIIGVALVSAAAVPLVIRLIEAFGSTLSAQDGTGRLSGGSTSGGRLKND
jgi:hypothetical protein